MSILQCPNCSTPELACSHLWGLVWSQPWRNYCEGTQSNIVWERLKWTSQLEPPTAAAKHVSSSAIFTCVRMSCLNARVGKCNMHWARYQHCFICSDTQFQRNQMHYSTSVLNNSELDDQKWSDGHDHHHHHVTVLWDLPVVADATQWHEDL